MTSVFLSYSHGDDVDARQIREGLENAGVEVFDAGTIPVGQSLAGAIETGLRRSDAFIPLLSQHFLDSDWGRLELATALAARTAGDGKMILPVVIDPHLESVGELPALLQSYMWLDARRGDRADTVARLLQALAVDRSQTNVEDELDADVRALRWRQAILTLERAAAEREVARTSRILMLMFVVGVLLSVGSVILAILVGDDSPVSTLVISVVAASAGFAASGLMRWGSRGDHHV